MSLCICMHSFPELFRGFPPVFVCSVLVCFCFVLVLVTCLFSNERERKGMDLGEWGDGENLGGFGPGKPWLENIVRKKIYFQQYQNYK